MTRADVTDPFDPRTPRTISGLDDPKAIVAEVTAEIEAFLAEKADEFTAISPDAREIGRALLDYTRGGKRIRPVLLWWGYQLAVGEDFDRERLSSGLAQAAGSLELLHAAALIHDDVIDHSDTRRGEPALHRKFESRHAAKGYKGEGDSFGVASAIVIGDICLALSEEMFERSQDSLGITAQARELRATLRRDVMVGQYLDVLAEVIPLSDERIGERAWEVLSFKSAKYSVEQPLLLGAAMGGADAEQLSEISRFGLPLGQAFQLRDDVLGIVGDPAATGKPSGDDIREGKRTVLIAETVRRLSSAQSEILADRLGVPSLTDAEVDECVEMITATGGLAAVEAFIEDKRAEALAVLDEWARAAEPVADQNSGPQSEPRTRLGDGAHRRLAEFADALAYRTS
ncbi:MULTISPECIES: polyprenyl synthetase family protein [unclassified Brevibacterium]|uniref:polyprenyl synthetase family protein n=1 Tax=unclassified Brevibacterium TaxID=2614124 RepID=UPI001E58DBCE|nr:MULTISPECIES: polyprenyl synthetase family protein [unclassified Brevibacterium]MCD1285193.1 polyprenyl synthetase [Brevibacterium sp. CCUG 69071]MDK8435184.1 polyprenyl synthetase family protein [Brevibacterium sp. H-BE7]